jgi:hypothetical protein
VKSINNLLELFPEMVTLNKNKGRSVFTAEEASIARQDQALLPSPFAHDSCGRKLGEVSSVIP